MAITDLAMRVVFLMFSLPEPLSRGQKAVQGEHPQGYLFVWVFMDYDHQEFPNLPLEER